MPLWNIVQVDPKTRRERLLGRVRAKNVGAACLRAYEKFAISDSASQRQVAARPVAAVKASPHLSEEERKELREISDAFNAVLKDFIQPR